jgi:hypothetical protein
MKIKGWPKILWMFKKVFWQGRSDAKVRGVHVPYVENLSK